MQIATAWNRIFRLANETGIFSIPIRAQGALLMRRIQPVVATVFFLLAGVPTSAQPRDAIDPQVLDRQLYDILRDVHNRGADLYNTPVKVSGIPLSPRFGSCLETALRLKATVAQGCMPRWWPFRCRTAGWVQPSPATWATWQQHHVRHSVIDQYEGCFPIATIWK
jgi:hypothetical protein